MTNLTPMTILVQRLREASKVERSHTMPHHGSYTVGQHSFDMLMLAICLYQGCSREFMMAVALHDIPERWTGDIPHPAKSADGEFGKRVAQLEIKVAKALGIEVKLTEIERFWLKGLDVVEYLLWCKEQLAMGNQNVMASFGATMSWLQHNKIPVPLAEFVNEHQWTRTPDQFPE